MVGLDEDALLRSLEHYRGRDRDRDRDRDRARGGRGELREEARAACREMVEDQGYEIVDVRDSDRTEAGMRLTSALRRHDGGLSR